MIQNVLYVLLLLGVIGGLGFFFSIKLNEYTKEYNLFYLFSATTFSFLLHRTPYDSC